MAEHLRRARCELTAGLMLMGMQFRKKTQYRAAGFVSGFNGIFWVTIELVVYSVFYRYAQNRDAVFAAGLTLTQLVSYAWLGQIFFALQSMGIDGDIHHQIVSGDVSVLLCRPFRLYNQWAARSAGSTLAGLLWRGLCMLLAALLAPKAFRLSAPAGMRGFCAFVLSILCAFLLCNAYAMFVTAIRLRITWGEGPTYILLLLSGVLSGGYLPLQLWPDALQKYLLYQPFAGYLDIPLRLYLGTAAPQDGWRYITLQLIWIILLILAGKWILHRNLARVSVQGG